MHDIEFVADEVGDANAEGFKSLEGDEKEIEEKLERWGLGKGDEADPKAVGQGDALILEAARALFDLKKQGLIRKAGISGELILSSTEGGRTKLIQFRSALRKATPYRHYSESPDS